MIDSLNFEFIQAFFFYSFFQADFLLYDKRSQQIILNINLIQKHTSMNNKINKKLKSLLLISFFLILTSGQLLNVDIFNIFGFSKYEQIIRKQYSIDDFVLNRVKLSNDQKRSSKQDYQQSNQFFKQKCQQFSGDYTIIVNKADIIVNITNFHDKQWIYIRKKDRSPFFSVKQIFSKREVGSNLTEQIIRSGAGGIKYSYQFKLTEDCILRDTVEQNYCSGVAISLISAIAYLLVLPPSRKYMSVISRRTFSLSIAINLQLQTVALFVILSHLIIRSFISFSWKISNFISILILAAVLFILSGYWIGISFCLLRKIQRVELFRNIHSFLIKIFVGVIALAVPLLFLMLPKGVHFHFYGLIPLYAQLFWLIKEKIGIPVRYLTFSIISNWCLIAFAKFYPILNFQVISAMDAYLLGLLYFFSMVILLFANWCCKRQQRQQGSDQPMNSFEDLSETIQLPEKPQQIQQISGSGIIKEAE